MEKRTKGYKSIYKIAQLQIYIKVNIKTTKEPN